MMKALPALVLTVTCLWLVSCDTKTKAVESCGDGFVDPGEECDTDVGENTCASLGHYNQIGTLVCTPLCKFDTTDCGGRCGDEDVDGGDGEECDGANLNGNSCQSLGYGGGTLACSLLCQYDKAGCTNACGNGYREGEEACDDGNNRAGDGCTDTCLVEEGWLCNDANPSRCTTVCLDGIVAGEEECDTTNLDGQTCETLGYYGGELECTFDCSFRLDACEAIGRCGDDAIQAEFSEACDGIDLADQTCDSLGLGTGTLGCRSDCSDFDTSGCNQSSTCGDGTVQSANGELCDGDNLNGQTCVTRGYYEGTLSCQSHCMAFDESLCQQRCGDGTIQTLHSEVCDGFNLNGETCESRGYYGGDLACNPNCTGFNPTGCTGYCGDSAVQTTDGEVCDGINLNSQSCVTQGYYGGTLTCSPNCAAFSFTGCEAVGRCGDTLVQVGYGEVCDGNNLNGQSCASRGFYAGGTLVCNTDCRSFNDASCQAAGRCGDGIIQTTYSEVCDGSNLNSQTCTSLGFYGGTLACSADCRSLVQTSCVTEGRCGDGIVQEGYGEECDGTNFNGNTCEDFTIGLPYGPLVCDSNCRVLTTNCRADFVTMIDVPGGTFQRDATPTNLSTVSAVKMGQTEVTRWQFFEVMGVDPSNTSYSIGENDPVQMVSWYDAIAFCNKLSLAEGLTPVYAVSGVDFNTLTYAQIPTSDESTWNAATANWGANGYRLPTEMEWMWAAMGADTANPGAVNTTGYAKAFAGSTGSNVIDDYAWYLSNSASKTHPVGTRLANELEFHDFSGNVRELTWDWAESYPTGTVTDYRGSTTGTNRMRHGGYWGNAALACTLAYQSSSAPSSRTNALGFRIAQKGDLCGDGTIQFAYDEQCEGSNLNGNSCQSVGFYQGAIGCDETTCQFDTSLCYDYCGDGTIQAYGGEECEGTDLAGETCASLGADGGTLACMNCRFDLRACDLASPNIGTFKNVPTGTFQRDYDPANLSVVSGFWMSQHEVTRAQWTAVTGWQDPTNATFSSGTSDPVARLNWYDAIAFCNKLSLLEGLTPVYSVSGVDFSTLTYAQIPTSDNATWNAATANWAANGYRLPTEMEWMWAAMGADTANPGALNTTGYAKAFAGSTGSNAIGDYAVFGYSYPSEVGRTTTQRTNPVGSKLPNELGFYDLSGNVRERLWDWYGTYPTGTLMDYRGPASGFTRLIRGGSWNDRSVYCTLYYAVNDYSQYTRSTYLGIRVVRQ